MVAVLRLAVVVGATAAAAPSLLTRLTPPPVSSPLLLQVVGLYERLDDVRPLLSLACLSPGPYLPLLTPMIDDLRGEG